MDNCEVGKVNLKKKNTRFRGVNNNDHHHRRRKCVRKFKRNYGHLRLNCVPRNTRNWTRYLHTKTFSH